MLCLVDLILHLCMVKTKSEFVWVGTSMENELVVGTARSVISAEIGSTVRKFNLAMKRYVGFSESGGFWVSGKGGKFWFVRKVELKRVVR